jgi:hypothetical protein
MILAYGLAYRLLLLRSYHCLLVQPCTWYNWYLCICWMLLSIPTLYLVLIAEPSLSSIRHFVTCLDFRIMLSGASLFDQLAKFMKVSPKGNELQFSSMWVGPIHAQYSFDNWWAPELLFSCSLQPAMSFDPYVESLREEVTWGRRYGEPWVSKAKTKKNVP